MIYDPSDARKLVEALGSNVTKSQHIMENLQSASNKLLTSIGPGTSMTGAAVEAGRGLFSQLVLPTIRKASEAIEKVSSEKDKLNELIGPAGGEILDEDKLNEQLQEKQQQQSNINSMINMYRMQGSLHSEDSKLSNMYSDFQKQWTGFLGTVEQDIEDINKKLQKLHTFNTGANALFTDSLSTLEAAMSGVIVLNHTTVNESNGQFKLPTGISLSDFKNKVLNPVDGAKESLAGVLDNIKETVIKDGKNIGRSWGAKLQPRANGRFTTDTFKPRKWVSGKLKRISNERSNFIGSSAKWGSRALVALGAYDNYKEYDAEYHNTGRALSYSATATAAGFAAGTVGSAAGGAIAVGLGATATGFIATIGAPVVGAIVVGAATTIAIKSAYDSNFLGLKDGVDFVGDKINDVGKALSNPLKSLKGAFGWG